MIVLYVLPRLCKRGLIIPREEFNAILHVTLGIKKVCSILLHRHRNPQAGVPYASSVVLSNLSSIILELQDLCAMHMQAKAGIFPT